MTECIRRPHTLWSTCPCDDCVRDRSRLRKAHRWGLVDRVPSSTAWEQLDAWNDEGFSPLWIDSAVGLPDGYTVRLFEERRNGERIRVIGPKYAHMIVNADIWAATQGRCKAIGARRRLQALARMGWTGAAMSEHSGISPITLASLQRGAAQRIAARLHHAITAMYDELEHQRGPSSITMRTAEKKGWHAPAMWDSPDADPEPRRATSRGAADPIVDESAVLRRVEGDHSVVLTRLERDEVIRILHRRGLTDGQITDRAGLVGRTVLRTRQRLGLPVNPDYVERRSA